MSNASNIAVTPDTLFSAGNLWQSWLDVEVALAVAQAELGIIPGWAAEGIAAVADVDILGLETLEREAVRTLAPIHALTRVVAEKAGPAGAYVHWGATTQNVMQTGRLILMRRAQRQLWSDFSGAVEHLAGMAEAHAETPMIARTNRRHALPISFGFKVAGWIEELTRAADRLATMERRVFVLPFGGAVGAMHAFDGQGREINRRMALRLGLGELLVAGRAVNDIFADYASAIGLWATTIERIGRELYVLMAEEIDEVSEALDHGVVGSSTMPHKVNPKKVVQVIAMAADLRAAVVPGMEGALTVNEGDAAANQLIVRTLDRVCPLALKLSRAFRALCTTTTPRPERMAQNVALTGTHTASERLMMMIAPELGHLQAHDLLHDLLAEHGSDPDMVAAKVAALPALKGRISLDSARAALDPHSYLGESVRIAQEGAAMGHALVARIRKGSVPAEAP
ncbi:MAG: hypothetical protein JJU21_08155 [Salinarimonas sp.]|nr:hypothetical protein [Salinarimonas sp.]